LPLDLSEGGKRGRRCLLITVSQVISRFIKVDFEQCIAATCPHGKFGIVFSNSAVIFEVNVVVEQKQA